VYVLLRGWLISLVTGMRQTTSTSTSTKEAYKPKFHAPAAQTGLFFQSPELQFQMLRALGASAYGART